MPSPCGTRRTGFCSVAALALALLGAPASASAHGVQIVSAGQRPAQVRAYWTRARMRSAVPASLLAPSPLSATGRDRATAGSGSGSLHHEVRHPGKYHYRTDGKVFFTMGLTNFECSGTAVKAPSRSLVWTAGHCVFDPALLGGGFATNWVFVPGYHGGKRPYGEWAALKLATTPQWQSSGGLPGSGGDPRFDFGAVTVHRRPTGQTLQGEIGARGIAFNQARNQDYKAYGYPAESPPPEFDGRHLFVCDSPYAGADQSFGSPPPLRIDCDMTGGASGGGWVVNGNVESVTSYGYQGQPDHLYGPYQGSAAHSLYHSARGG